MMKETDNPQLITDNKTDYRLHPLMTPSYKLSVMSYLFRNELSIVNGKLLVVSCQS